MDNKDKYFTRKRPELVQFLPAKYSTVLEIGCGTGDFKYNLTEPCEYWGIEPSPEAQREASQKLDRAILGLYENTHDLLPDNYFDLVICNDVIEHMIDHDHFFTSIKSKLTPNGIMVGSIPNVRYFSNLNELIFKKDWQYVDAGILDRTHLRFFTKKSLLRTLSQHDFEIKKFKPINSAWKKSFGIKNVLRIIRQAPVFFVFGLDMRFLQFGFKVTKK